MKAVPKAQVVQPILAMLFDFFHKHSNSSKVELLMSDTPQDLLYHWQFAEHNNVKAKTIDKVVSFISAEYVCVGINYSSQGVERWN